MTEIPVMLAAAPLVDMSNPSQRYEEQYCSLAEAPIRWLEALKMGEPIVNRFCHVSVLSYAVLKRGEPIVNRFCHVCYAVLKRGKPVVKRFCHVSVLSYAVLKRGKPVVSEVVGGSEDG